MYPVVIVPKKVLYGKRELCWYKDIEMLEGHAMPDHTHICISVPPKYRVAMVIGYLKGKSAIRIHWEILGVTKGFTNKNFWIRGYCVSTVGLNEGQIREYIKNQEYLDTGKEPVIKFV
jgi:putative transposase